MRGCCDNVGDANGAAELNGLSLSAADAALRDSAVARLAMVAMLPVASAETAITELLNAIDEVRSITTANVSTIRIGMAELLRIWEARSVL